MALSITTFPALQLRQGAMPQAPMLSPVCATQSVALGAQSTAIAGPCLIQAKAGEATRITVQKAAGYAAPSGTAGVAMESGDASFFELPAGSWYINAAGG